MATFNAEGYQARELEVEGWPVRVVSYKLATRWSCRVDNVSPGATVARGMGDSREEAESDALGRATVRLKLTRRVEVLSKELKEARATIEDLESSGA